MSTVSLVATLGGQPQVVTFTLDLLLRQGEDIQQVAVFFLSGDARYRQSYQRLAREFHGDLYKGRRCRLRPVQIEREGAPLRVLKSPEDVEAARAAIFSYFSEMKSAGNRLHVSLSGGRRILALVALSAAMQYLTPADKIWHIYTPPKIAEEAKDGARMHVPPESGVSLVGVPFVPWTAYFPGLRSVLGLSAEEAANPRLTWLSEEERAACRVLWESLTSREREVLRALTLGGFRKEMAEGLGIATTTLDTHLRNIHRKAKTLWGEDISREKLRDRFALYLARPTGV